MPLVDNKNHLENAIRSRLHRNVDGELIYGWIDITRFRIGQWLRSKANEGYIVLSPEAGTQNTYLLPEDYQEMRFVEQVNGDVNQQILPMGVSSAHRFQTNASTAFGYQVFSDVETIQTNINIQTQTLTSSLRLIPGNGLDIAVDYYQTPAPLGDVANGIGTVTNPVLQAHPELYMFGVLSEGWSYVQNFQESQRYDTLFKEEIASVNKASNASRYGAGAAASAPARFYNNAPSRTM